MTSDSEVLDFDNLKAVADYRKIMAELEAATSPEGNEEFTRIVRRMRERWAAWQGEDSLHAMAFGEPEE